MLKNKIKKLIYKPNLYFFDYFRKKLGISKIYIKNSQLKKFKSCSPYSSKYWNFIVKNKDFLGSKRYCNICGYRFEKFITVSNVRPREAQCPVCGSLERHRHLNIFIQSIYPFLEGKKILHFAAESFFKNLFKESGADYYDADIVKGRASYQVDMTDMHFENNTFDYIFASHVLEHIPNDHLAMSELFRVLKRGGVAYLSVPLRQEFSEDLTITDPKQRSRLFGQSDHVRYYSLEVFCERLNNAGFNTELISGPKSLPALLVREAKLVAEFPFNDTDINDTFVLARKL